MDKDRFKKISEIFAAALALEEAHRDAFLRSECGEDTELRSEVDRLLGHHMETAGPLTETVGGRLPQQQELVREALGRDREENRNVPEQIGNYRVIRKIGQGGMGTVYEALQQNPERTVALKLVSARFASEASLKRFEYESYVLGQLQHPGIAQVYEAGMSRGPDGVEPFFAMEYVQGEPLNEYAVRHALRTPEILELVQKICSAIHHAHQKGIVHRDLKPGNILVTADGSPKILDFGIARAIDDGARQETLQTGTGEIVGTLAYMSPEQASGDPALIDTRSDIYSLGIILYELLAGRLPFQIDTTSLYDALKAIRDDDPPPIGRARPALRGDIETIVHTALAKERDRRYASAAGLGADIGRFLRSEPIAAHPPSAAYQLKKFAARHKTLVGAAVVVLIVLVAGIATSTWYAFEAHRESELSKRRLAESEAVSSFLQRAFGGMDPYNDFTPKDMKHSEYLRRQFVTLEEQDIPPATRAALLESLAMAYYGISFYEDAEKHAVEAVELRRDLSEEASPELADSLWNLAHILQRQGRYEEVRETLEEVLAIKAELVGDKPDSRVAEALDLLSTVLWFTNAGGEVETQRRALAIHRALHPGDSDEVATALHHLGTLLSKKQPAEAEQLFQNAIAMLRRLHGGDENVLVSLAREKLAEHFLTHDRTEEALSILREVLATRRRLLPGDHPDLATTLALTARAHSRVNSLKEALRLADEALRIRDKIFAPPHRHTAASLRQVGVLARRTGNTTRSLVELERALAMLQELTPEPDAAVAGCLSSLAETHAWRGDFESAVEAQQRALAISRARSAGSNSLKALAMQLGKTASICLRAGEADEARTLAEEALATLRKNPGPDHPGTLSVEAILATALLFTAPDSKDAEEILRRTIPRLDEHAGINSDVAAQSRLHLARLLNTRGEFAEAATLLQTARESIEGRLGPAHDETLQVKRLLGVSLISLERHDEAEPLLVECYRYSGETVEIRRALDLLLLNYGGNPSRQAALLKKLQAADAARGEVPNAGTLEVVNALSPVLQGGPFESTDRRVRHLLSYWELCEEDAEYVLNPTYATVSRKHLTTLELPPGIILPDRTYRWRVLYVGSDMIATGFSAQQRIRTGGLPLGVVRFDLAGAFGQDVVAGLDDPRDDFFDGDRRGLLLVDGYGARSPEDPGARGLPLHRNVGVHTLGDYAKANAVQLSARDDAPVRLECRPHRSVLLRFLVSGGNGDSAIPVELHHAGGLRSRALVHCDDWFHDHPPDNIGTLRPGVTPIHNGMDRLYMGNVDDVNDPALFESIVVVEETRPLEAVVLLPAEGKYDDAETTRFNLFALTSIEKQDGAR